MSFDVVISKALFLVKNSMFSFWMLIKKKYTAMKHIPNSMFRINEKNIRNVLHQLTWMVSWMRIAPILIREDKTDNNILPIRKIHHWIHKIRKCNIASKIMTKWTKSSNFILKQFYLFSWTAGNSIFKSTSLLVQILAVIRIYE